MSSRRAVVRALRRMVFAYRVMGDTGHRVRVYEQAAERISAMADDLEPARRDGSLARTPGVGASVLAVVDAVLAGEVPEALADVEQVVPSGVFDMGRVAGLGPKRVAVLWSELGIASLAELQYACRENRLIALQGFGAKLQDKVAASTAELLRANAFVRVDQAWAAVATLRREDPDLVVVGELRRACELIRTVVVVSQTLSPELGEVDGVPVAIVPAEPTPVRTWWWTGSEAHRDAVVAHAARRGLRLCEDGLFRKRTAIPVPSVDALYRHLDLTPVPPEQREGAVLLRDALPPRLVRRSDLRGALHNHTVASDGRGTLVQMRDAAAARDLEYLGISDHSPRAWYANGLDAQRLSEQVAQIGALPPGPCTLLTGVEADILTDGALDHPPSVLGEVEIVIGSIHDRAGQPGPALTARLVAATARAHVIGHPTGRLLLGRPASDIDIPALIAACAQSGCAVELNASPQRLDLCAEHLVLARDAGVLVSIAADAHAPDELDNLDFGVALARRAGLRPDDVLNTRSLAAVRDWARSRTLAG